MRNLKYRKLNDTRATGNNAECLPKGLYISLPSKSILPFTWPSSLSITWAYWPIWSPPFTNMSFSQECFFITPPPFLLTPQTPGAPSHIHSIKYLLSTSSGDTKMNEVMPWPWRKGKKKLLHYSTVSVLLTMHRCCRVGGVALGLNLQHCGHWSPGEGESYHSAPKSRIPSLIKTPLQSLAPSCK